MTSLSLGNSLNVKVELRNLLQFKSLSLGNLPRA